VERQGAHAEGPMGLAIAERWLRWWTRKGRRLRPPLRCSTFAGPRGGSHGLAVRVQAVRSRWPAEAQDER